MNGWMSYDYRMEEESERRTAEGADADYDPSMEHELTVISSAIHGYLSKRNDALTAAVEFGLIDEAMCKQKKEVVRVYGMKLAERLRSVADKMETKL